MLQDAGTYREQFEALLLRNAHSADEEWRSWDVYKARLASDCLSLQPSDTMHIP